MVTWVKATWVLLGALALVVLVTVARPYLMHNTLQGGDAVGHVYETERIRDSLLPALHGWNPDVFNGYPIGLAYPPLSRVLAMALGLLLGGVGAYKALIVVGMLSALLLPFVMMRRSGRGVAEAALFALLHFLALSIPGAWYGIEPAMGVNLESSFGSGMLAALLGYVLFLLLFFEAGRDDPSPFKMTMYTGLALLTHFVAGAVALVLLTVTSQMVLGGRRRLVALAFPALALVLAAGAYGPMLSAGGAVAAEYVGYLWNPVTLLLLAGSALAPLVAMIMARDQASPPSPSPAQVTFLLLMFLGGAFDALEFPTHFYRLTPFLLVFSICTLARFVARRQALAAGLVGAAALATALVIAGGRPPAGNPELVVPSTLTLPDGRVFTMAPALHAPGLMSVPVLLQQRAGWQVDSGISIESALNARSLFYIKSLVSRVLPIWTGLVASAPGAAPWDELRHRLTYMGYRYVLTDIELETIYPEAAPSPSGSKILVYPNRLNVKPGGPFALSEDAADFHYSLYTLAPDLPPATVVDGTSLRHSASLDRSSLDDWWRRFPDAKIPYSCDKELGSSTPAVTPAVSVTFTSDESFTLTVSGTSPAPVLIRHSWHPFWRAWQQQPGAEQRSEIEICQVAPHFMLISAAGEIEFVYDKPGPGWVLLSLLAFLVLIALRVLRPRFWTAQGALGN